MKRLAAALAGITAAGVGTAYGIYRMAFYQKPKVNIPSATEWAQGSRFLPQIQENADFVDNLKYETMQITADDGTLLSAQYCHEADGAPLAIIMHGYRSTGTRDSMGLIVLCKKMGYNILLPDQRAHGRSGGHTITMGAQERFDVRAWAYWAAVRFGAETPIFLLGVSMGAATVLMASGLDLPKNVHGIVADCGYSSIRDITRKCLPEFLPHVPVGPGYAVGKAGALLFGHFDPDDADCRSAVARATVPILFIHGDKDTFVPCEMSRENYAACASEKELLIVPEATHAMSYYYDTPTYTKTVTEFLKKHA